MNALLPTKRLTGLGWFMGLIPLSLWSQTGGFVPLKIRDIAGIQITALTQDDQGALWMGSDRGLLRFDGTTVESTVSDPGDPRAIPSDVVYDLLVDRSGELIVATSGGAFKMNPVNGRHRPLLFQQGSGAPRAIECLSVAASTNGIWAFCGMSGLYRWAPGDSVLHPVACPKGAPGRASHGWEAPDGGLWFSDRRSLRHLDLNTGTETEFPCRPFGDDAPAKTLLLRVLPDRYDPAILWCSSWGMGLLRFDTRTGSFTPFVRTRPLGDLWNIVTSALQIGPDRWFLTMDNGLWELSTAQAEGAWTAVPDGPDRPNALLGLKNGSVLCGGMEEVRLRPEPVMGIHSVEGRFTAGNLHTVRARQGGYWAVHYYSDRALLRLDDAGSVMASFAFQDTDGPIEPFQVLEARDGTVWMATTRGLWRHRPGSSELGPVRLDTLPQAIQDALVWDLYEDPDGFLWLALGAQGLVRFDPRNGTAQRVLPRAGMTLGEIMKVDRSDAEHVLAVQRAGPPCVVHRRTLEGKLITGPELPRHAFTTIQGAVATADGALYTYHQATGLKRFRQKAKGHWYQEREWYLPARPVFQDAAIDGRGRIWALSDRGTYLLDPATDLVHPVDALHGVPHSGYGLIEALTDGGILLTGRSLVHFAQELNPLHDTVRLVLRRVLVNGEDLTAAFLDAAPMELAHDRNDLSLSFSCIALHDGGAFQYAYRTTVNDRVGEWKSLGDAHTLNLLGLGAGEHLIELRAEGPSTLRAETRITFTVLPPWWATWWASSVLALLAAGIIVIATRMVLDVRHRRTVHELEREREVDRVRMRISRDIHDGIGSGLTRITMLSRQLEQEVGPRAERIANAATELVGELGEIVWTVDPRNDDVASFAAYVRNTLGRQFEDLPMRLDLDIRVPASAADHILGPEVNRQLMLFLKEAVNNAMKHAGARTVRVTFAIVRDRLTLTVADDGQGFDPALVRQGSHGLSNFQRRAAVLRGTVNVETGPGGTSVVLEAPLPSTNMGVTRKGPHLLS